MTAFFRGCDDKYYHQIFDDMESNTLMPHAFVFFKSKEFVFFFFAQKS